MDLSAFQRFNLETYSEVNDRDYSNADLMSHLHRHITRILKAVRKKHYDSIAYHLYMSLSWSMAILNRLHFNVQKEMWKLFPGFCPYCHDAPCSCKERRDERLEPREPEGKEPKSINDWQEMFAAIYRNLLQDSAIHLAEEAGEADEALRNYASTHDGKYLREAVLEIIDVITNIFGVANCMGYNLDSGFKCYFSKGCPKCQQKPCVCSYVAIDLPPKG